MTGPAGFDYVRADVTDDAAVRLAVEQAVVALGGLDVLVNNAGIGAQGGVEANDDDEWHRVLDVNVLGMVRVTRAALPELRRSTAAAIVNTCSIAATAGLPNRALYSASKGAVLSLTLAMAADLTADGIRVNAVNPGTADTPWVGRLLDSADDPAAERAALEARQPHGRLVSADEVADAIAYLASPSAGSTTGTSLPSTAAWRGCGCGRGGDVRRIASVIRLRPEKEAEYRALHADAWPGVLGDTARGQHHQLLHLPARRPAVQLSRVRRRRLRRRHGAHRRRRDHPALVEAHRPVPATPRHRGRRRVVGAGRRAVPRD